MKREEDQKLWDLLGRATEPAAASPFFARNVLRKIREARGEGESSSNRSWYVRWLVPAAGVAVVIIAGLALPSQIIKQNHSAPRSEMALSVDGQDNELIADLDDLMADESALDDAVLL